MKNAIGFFLLVVLVSSPGPAAADSRLQELLTGTAVTPALSGLQVSLLEAGQVTDSYALGIARMSDGQAVPLRSDHKIRVASISKLVVAIGVMRLVEAGQLKLDGNVSDYLGWELSNPLFAHRPITARQLLSHTSSLRDGPRYYINAGRGDLREFFDPSSVFWDGGAHFGSQPAMEPGRYFTYANLNFGILGELIERVSGERFDLYMQNHVLKPLGLSASFDPCDINPDQLASTFRKRSPGGDWNPRGSWVAQVDGESPICFYGFDTIDDPDGYLDAYPMGSNASIFSPQGGLRASADDLATVLSVLAGGGGLDGVRLLDGESVAELMEPAWTLNAAGDNGNSSGEALPGGPTDGLMTSYGLSVHRIDLRAWGFAHGPALLVGHLGEANGVLSHALFDPESGDGIVAIITGTADAPGDSPPGSSPLYRVEEEILRWWLERRLSTP